MKKVIENAIQEYKKDLDEISIENLKEKMNSYAQVIREQREQHLKISAQFREE